MIYRISGFIFHGFCGRADVYASLAASIFTGLKRRMEAGQRAVRVKVNWL